jgi:hypothetical protein
VKGHDSTAGREFPDGAVGFIASDPLPRQTQAERGWW